MSVGSVSTRVGPPQQPPMIGLDAAAIQCDRTGWRQMRLAGREAFGDENLGVPGRLPFLQNHKPSFFPNFGITHRGIKQSEADDVLRLEIETRDVRGEAEPWISAHDWDNPQA
jgi:hypothetical protein